jgi:hypothetical protein
MQMKEFIESNVLGLGTMGSPAFLLHPHYFGKTGTQRH